MKSLRPNRGLPFLLGALLVWLLFEALQAAVVLGLGSGATPLPKVAAVFALHGIAWTIITLWLLETSSLLTRVRSRAFVVAAHLVFFFVVAAADALVRRVTSEVFIGPVTVGFARTMLYYADVTALSYIVAVWLGKVAEAREELVRHSKHELALQTHLARARLGYLHAQLQPHFLFNALGTVSELIFENPAEAIRTFRQLLAVLRAAASRDVAEIPLKEEIEVLLPYLEVQRARFSDWLEIELDIDEGARDLRVPPLILQPLVENSIRHGLRARSSRGRISIAAHVRGKQLVLSVTDNGVGLSPRHGVRKGGVGLSNTEERLRTLYGAAATFRLFNDDAGGTVAEVSMPARGESPERADQPEAAAAVTVRTPGFAQRHPAIAIVIGCVVAAALWTQQSYAYMVMSGQLGDTTPMDVLKNDFVLVAAWAAMVPAATLTARRFPPTGQRWLGATLLHLCVVFALGLAHSVVTMFYRNASDLSGLVTTFRGSFTITLLVYLGSLAYSQRRVLEDWLAHRQVAALRLCAEITEAQIGAASMSVSPESLDFTLRELERYAEDNPLEAERAVARLGSELRSRLETAGESAPWTEGSGVSGPGRGEDRVERLAMGA